MNWLNITMLYIYIVVLLYYDLVCMNDRPNVGNIFTCNLIV